MDLRKVFHNKAIVAFIISIITIALVGFLSLERLPFLGSWSGVFVESANLGIKNILFSRFGANDQPNKAITIVAIDNKTLSDTEGLGRFQNFKRAYYAKVIDNLKKDGALVIGVDVLFSEVSEEDASLALSIKNAWNVVLGFSLTEKLFPISAFSENAFGSGYFHPERNTYNSTVYSIIPEKTGGKAFSFEMAQKYFDSNPKEDMRPLKFSGLSVYPFEGKQAKRQVPYTSKNARDVFINYLPLGAKFQEISFIDAYNGSYPKDQVEGKLIIIGSTATALYDKFNTPLGIQDGVMVHANMINTILNQKYIVEVEKWKEITILIALTFLLILFTLHVKNRASQILYLLFGFVIFSTLEAIYFVLFQRLFTFPMQLILIVVFTTIFVTGYKYMYEEEGKRLLKSTLSQYLAEDLVMNVLENYEEVKLGGTRKTITSFFSDIEGFTGISENMEPEELVHFLSIYLKEVSDIIMHERGFINKYEWDAVMALWGAFWDEQEQSIFACRSALIQQEKIGELNLEFQKTHGFEIRVRMGINKGVAVVGNIGSMGKKIEYTALGDSVNTASRFEGINKIYGTLICVGESVMNDSKEVFAFRKLDNIQVKGKEKPVLLYELLGLRSTISHKTILLAKRFEEGLELYFSRQFDAAFALFSELSMAYADAPSAVFMKRCETMKWVTLGDDWNGTYRATEK